MHKKEVEQKLKKESEKIFMYVINSVMVEEVKIGTKSIRRQQKRN